MKTDTVILRTLPLQPYETTWQAMQAFTNQRDEETLDEIWLVEHLPIFTQGQNGHPQHVLQAGDIAVIKTDRGGQVTYHGPGQLLAYILLDLKRKKFTVRDLVSRLEKSVIDLLAEYSVTAIAKCDAPGVYVNDKKICSVGLRIRRGCSFHGLALNVEMDLSPFSRIHPCGFPTLEMTQLSELKKEIDLPTTRLKLTEYLIKNLGYTYSHGK